MQRFYLCGAVNHSNIMSDRLSKLVAVRTVAFVGLGSMGRPMAENLAEKLPAAVSLLVLDALPAVVDAFLASPRVAAAGRVRRAASAADVARSADLVFTALPGPAEALDMYATFAEAIADLDSKPVFVELGTVGSSCVKRCNGMVAGAGGTVVDSPMSGGIGRAAAGTLTFMVGVDDCAAAPSDVAATTPLLDALRQFLSLIGTTIYLVGTVGTAQTAKLLNNANEYSSLLALSETLLVGKAHGIDPKLLSAIVNASTGQTWVSSNYSPAPGITDDVPSSRGYQLPGFPLFGAVKDLTLAVKAAQDVGISPVLGSVVLEANKAACEDDSRRRLDYTVIYQAIAQKWGVDVSAL
ncbi:6-phosphogluconate dehydrogenase [Hyaloraphidium curvatum]|nr:6-phosphogluconate dehydrogenase [Hyaloraphidium curvatum]